MASFYELHIQSFYKKNIEIIIALDYKKFDAHIYNWISFTQCQNCNSRNSIKNRIRYLSIFLFLIKRINGTLKLISIL